MKLENKTYDILKFIAQIVLPALGTFYFAIASIWGLPYAEQIVGTISAVDVLLGALLGISTSMYNKEKEETDKIFKAQNGLVDAEIKEK